MFEYEEQTEIIGARCTLHEAYKGYAKLCYFQHNMANVEYKVM